MSNLNIPIDFLEKKGSELFKVQGGFAFKSEDYSEDGYFLVRIGNVGKGRFDYKDPVYVKVKSTSVLDNFLIKENDVLMGLTGDLGKICFVEKAHKLVLNQRVARFLNDEKLIDKKYLYYLISSEEVQETFESFFAGGAQKNISPKKIEEVKYLLPSNIEEQKKIAEILTKVDEAIENTEKLIQKYEQVKVGLMQDLLTKGIDENGNIRSEETHQFKDSPLGRIPVEWDFSLIGDICFVTKLSGFEFTKYMKYKEDGEIIALRALNIKNKKIVLNDIQRISKHISDNLVRSKLFKDDILITYIGAYIGAVAMVHENDKFHLAPNIAKLTAGRRLTPSFLLEILDSEKVQNYFKSLITTTANPSLTMGQIRNTFIIYPKEKLEQEKISLVIKKNVDILDSYNNELKNLKNIKQGLMQDLLSGSVRINY